MNDNSKNLLLTLGRFLQTISNQAEGWGDGVLGAFGLKKDGISKRYECYDSINLICLIIQLFLDDGC